MQSAEEFLTTPEASSFIKIAIPTLQGYRVKGGGPPFSKIGRRVVYSRGDLLAFVLGNRRKSTSDKGAPSTAVS
jgi:hypothetical protein